MLTSLAARSSGPLPSQAQNSINSTNTLKNKIKMKALHFHLHLQTRLLSDQSNPHSSSISSPLSFHLGLRDQRSCRTKPILISCKASNGRNSKNRLNNGDDHDDDDYIQALLMVPETVKHHHLRSRGFLEETNWNTGLLLPFSIQPNDSKSDFKSSGHEFLRRFQNPAIFLELACDGDLILPIIVGEFAIERLIDSLRDDNDGDCPDQFQLVKNVVDRLGYEVKKVRITERIVNTYYAKILFSKRGEKTTLTVDARPSDAINVAERCRVPIYVNKQIVLTDAIIYGTQRRKNTKSVYDVLLDSAAEGTELVAEELHLVEKLNSAIKEERYNDAATLRDKLVRLRSLNYEV